jgi:hypothetical protein
MGDTTLLKEVDTNYQALEDAIVYFFGMPVDFLLTGKVFNYTTVDGTISSIFRLAADPGEDYLTGPGWRYRDTANNDEFLMMCVDGYLRIFNNSGSQGSPNWGEINKMNLATGVWDMGALDDTGIGCRAFDVVQYVDYSSGAMVQFRFEAFDDEDFWSTADKTKFIIPHAGRYRVSWDIDCQFLHDPEVTGQSIFASLYLNGVEIVDSRVGTGEKDYTGVGFTPFTNHGTFPFDDLVVNDYIQLGAIVDPGSYADAWLFGGRFEIERIS